MQDTRTRQTRVRVTRIAVPKPSHVLADHLRESILRGEIAEGESLPPERQLVEQTGLSRGAVREALRTLAVEGLVHTRNGRFGGSIATLPGNDSMAASINRFVKGRKLSLRALQETREVLEPCLARWAATRRSADQMQQLEALHAELIASAGNFHEFARINVVWHNAIAGASGNDLLAAVLYSISYGIHVATTSDEYDTPQTRQQVIRIHAQINDAIAAGDADAAERAMRLHMRATHARPLALGASSIPLSDESTPRKVKPRAGARRSQR